MQSIQNGDLIKCFPISPQSLSPAIVPQFCRNDPVPLSTDGILKTVLQIEQLLHSNKRWLHNFVFRINANDFNFGKHHITFFFPPPPPPMSYPVLVGGKVKDRHFSHHAAMSLTDLKGRTDEQAVTTDTQFCPITVMRETTQRNLLNENTRRFHFHQLQIFHSLGFGNSFFSTLTLSLFKRSHMECIAM